ncbi:MAG: glycosyltransferase family 4 protein [bacterium]|nr:glycosyltransferase family 4 protein [bacterium]
MSKLKILALDQGEHVGGAEIFFSEILNRASSDYDIHLVTAGGAEYLSSYAHCSVIIHQIELPRLRPFSISTYFKYRGAQRNLQKLIEETSPDLILSNTVRTHLLISPVAKRLKVPLIWMANDLTFPRFFLKRFLKYPKAIISCSGYVQDYYRGFTGKRDISLHTIYPYGIDEHQLKSISSIKKRPIIGMVGRFIPWKGQELFIRAVAELSKKFPEYRFEIIGQPYRGNSKSESYFRHCHQLIRELNIDSLLTIHQSVPDVLEAIASWEVLVHCSIEPEPLGRVILEGMSAGCAVVASDQGGPREVLDQGRTGMLIDVHEQGALARCLRRLISDSDERRSLGESALQEIKKNYSWDKVISAFRKALE